MGWRVREMAGKRFSMTCFVSGSLRWNLAPPATIAKTSTPEAKHTSQCIGLHFVALRRLSRVQLRPVLFDALHLTLRQNKQRARTISSIGQ